MFAEEPEHPDLTNADSSVAVVTEERPSLEMLKATGLERSWFKDFANGLQKRTSQSVITDLPHANVPQANLSAFTSTIKPMLERHCVDCHGPDTAEGNVRIDTLDPDLVKGADTDWWSEIFAVITKGEMPPPGESELNDSDRQQLVDWLSAELQTASIVRRRSSEGSTFRRMTRYEYNHALQDLLGLPFDFATDLPPEAHSEDGFQNSSDLLHLSVTQFETYHRIARAALRRATVSGEQPPTLYWGIAMKDAAQREWLKQDKLINALEKKLKDDPEKLADEHQKLLRSFEAPRGVAYYKNLSTDRTAKTEWDYGGASFAFAPQERPVEIPDEYDCVAILPIGQHPRLIIELGNQLPDEGVMRVTVRASRVNAESEYAPSLQLLFGWQASNEGRALLRVSKDDLAVTANADQPQIIQWDVPLGEIYPRNSVRKTSPMGGLPSPSEYIRLVNASASASDIQIDYVRVAAPVYDQWPPESHRRIFLSDHNSSDEQSRARETITNFMTRAWRRPINKDEINDKLKLFATMRPQCDTFEEAVVEVLATVLSSPQFLYIANSPSNVDRVNVDAQRQNAQSQNAQRQTVQESRLDSHSLASRLSIFLWCSIPDEELMAVADAGQLTDHAVLAAQVQRMLNDPRSERFAEQFVHQWLDLQLLEFQNFKQHQPGFDPLLKEAMLHEPVALFEEILRENASVLDFIHCDYAMLNERLARHYGLPGVYGNHFQRVQIGDDFRRGGLLTQAGLLAMNSDWPDSHPLKRAIWLLESVLADPPPPPPPAVPQIDLADPEIAKMTLKERIENHRNHAACMSCHSKIDPWGIAFENYDALGKWRDSINGKPIDAASELFNQQSIDGMDGLKRFLLHSRQDQFVRATVSKLATFALGRPLSFADRADIDAITAQVRRDGDGLRTIVAAIIQSDLFQSY
jgi:mono/diheme cytochrome c family protein